MRKILFGILSSSLSFLFPRIPGNKSAVNAVEDYGKWNLILMFMLK